MNSPAETLTPIVESRGFTLVEEDDVAFSLSLCKEIHRIYGSYQSGELEATDSVHVGLVLTAQVLSTLAGRVSKGMPAMRIEVAWAQTSEMMAVMFGEPITRKASRTARQQLQKGGSHPSGAVRSAPDFKAIPSVSDQGVQPEPLPAANGASRPDPVPAAAALDSSAGMDQEQHSQVKPWDRCRRWMASLPWWSQTLLGAFGCVLVAVVIDVPIVALLLFSDMAVQLSSVYALAFAAWWAFRRLNARTTGEDPVPSRNPLSWDSWNGKASPTCTAR
ncbi:MAG TPA: hypothetical protein VFV02_16800 [Acidimicrobiales bacterium]|nr:hypothetical protein [Acidimicrobiales bacterium]